MSRAMAINTSRMIRRMCAGICEPARIVSIRIVSEKVGGELQR